MPQFQCLTMIHGCHQVIAEHSSSSPQCSTHSLRPACTAHCRYVARLGKGAISVYELPDMTLLDKRSAKLEGVQDFAWSPAQPILCAYQTEQAGGNLPARISLIGFPDKRELRQKNLFSVSGAHFPSPFGGSPQVSPAPTW